MILIVEANCILSVSVEEAECIVWEIQGEAPQHGVSWFDDNGTCNLAVLWNSNLN